MTDIRRSKIKYISEQTKTTETAVQSKRFIKHVADNLLPHIKEIPIDLVDKYILSCDEEESLVVCNVL
jgi:hypothetical protein